MRIQGDYSNAITEQVIPKSLEKSLRKKVGEDIKAWARLESLRNYILKIPFSINTNDMPFSLMFNSEKEVNASLKQQNRRAPLLLIICLN